MAAIGVRVMGTRMERKNRIELAPSIWEASAISLGTDMKNCLKRKTAVADTIMGKMSPA